MKFKREINIQSIEDLEDYLYEEIGIIDMEDVRNLIDLFKKYGYLLEVD